MEQLLATLDSEPRLSQKKRPNKHTHRVEWNDHMAHDIAVQYAGFPFSSVQRFCVRFPEILRAPQCDRVHDTTERNICIARVTKDIMLDEGSLVALAVENLLSGNFEADWNDLDTKRKKEIVLEGLYRGACAAPRDNSRITCPEMTIQGLVGDEKYNLINLLRRLFEHDSTGNLRAEKLFLFMHPYVEHEYGYNDETPDVVKLSPALPGLSPAHCDSKKRLSRLNLSGLKPTKYRYIQ
ncbi:hypothetical protein C8J57DRAFT_1234017 [Mycena rebaudengoi]|nr:hypothetical protein C8J57DRAFT_1234017 [Mycena rebaudengoi]